MDIGTRFNEGDEVRLVNIRHDSLLTGSGGVEIGTVYTVERSVVYTSNQSTVSLISSGGHQIERYMDQFELVGEEMKVVVSGSIEVGDKVRVKYVDFSSFLPNLINSDTGEKVKIGDVGIVEGFEGGDIKIKGWCYPARSEPTGIMRSQFEKVEDTVSTVEKKPFVKGDRVKVVKVMSGLGMNLGDLGEISETREPESAFLNIHILANGRVSKGLYSSQFIHAGPNDVWTGDRVNIVGRVGEFKVNDVSSGGAALTDGTWYAPERLTRVLTPTQEEIPAVPKTADAMLRMIDEFFLRGNDEAANLQHVLAAVRGADSQDNEVKLQTTTHIRKAAFPKTGASNHALNMSFDTSTYGYTEPSAYGHFEGHIRDAATALRAMGRKVG